MFYIKCLAFFLWCFQSGKSDEAEILETYEYSGGIYRENRTALMTVLYKKPTSFRAQWTLQKTGLGYSEPIRFEEEMKPKYRTQIDGTMNDTVVIKTKLDRSGTYTFRIIDPITNKTVQTANFTLKILAAPRETSIQMVGGGYPRNLQLGQNYNFECSTAGYPLPEIHWEMNSCIEELDRLCEDVWKPLISATEAQSVESTYYRKQKIGFRADQIGAVRCVANNTEGTDVTGNHGSEGDKEFIIIPSDIVDTEINSGMSISQQTCDETMTFRGDEFNLTCQVQKYEFKPLLVWAKKQSNGDEVVLTKQLENHILYRSNLSEHQIHFDEISSNFSNKFTLQFINISKDDEGFYRCKTSDYYGRDFIRTVEVTVNDDSVPQEILFSNGFPVTIPCKVCATSPADVIWYKNGEIFDTSLNGNIRKSAELLQFNQTFLADEGLYVCRATNRVWNNKRSYQLRYQSVPVKHLVPITLSIAGVVILLIFTAIVSYLAILNSRRNQDLWKLQKEFEENEANEFDPTLPIFEQIEKGNLALRPGYPFCLKADELLIERKQLVTLGSGQFGVVLQVGLKQPDDSIKQVALKRPKCNWDVDQYRMLYGEICFMSYLGRNPNIVNMIGCVTNIAKGQLYMVMELCEDGSLLNFLHSLRETDKFFSELHHVEEYQNIESNEFFYFREFSPQWPIIKASLKGYRFHSDLIAYAYQLASGMQYLASINFVHRDLATRNVLLSDNFKIAKIADFGLSLQISGNRNYFRERYTDKLVLPARSTAPEAMINYKFSTASDVWSFGILLCEIFSLGDLPFAHINGDVDPYKLQRGEIYPERPKFASKTVYELIRSCCQPEEKNRITFTDAKVKLSTELNRCEPEQYSQIRAMLDAVQLSIDSVLLQPVNHSISYSDPPRSHASYRMRQNRFACVLGQIPKIGTKNRFTVNSRYTPDKTILRRVTPGYDTTIICKDDSRKTIGNTKFSTDSPPIQV